MQHLNLDDLGQYSDVLLSRSGAAVTVRFVELRRCGRAAGLFSRPVGAVALQSPDGRRQRIAGRATRQVHPCRRGRRLSRSSRRCRAMASRPLSAKPATRSMKRRRGFELGLSVARFHARPGHRRGTDVQSGMPCCCAGCRPAVRRYIALQRRNAGTGSQGRLHLRADAGRLEAGALRKADRCGATANSLCDLAPRSAIAAADTCLSAGQYRVATFRQGSDATKQSNSRL